MKKPNYETVFGGYLKPIERTLQEVLPPADQYPAEIHEAMRYAIFPGGKRIRPVLTLAACEALGGDLQDALLPAAAMELVHGYSLVHDDLPALDNDDERRGKPSCHKQFGEAMAILAGDGLLTLSLQILTRVRPAEVAVRLLEEISTSSGTYGMIGGQVVDLLAERTGAGLSRNLPLLDYISSHKTGKLIKAAVVSGALVARASQKDLQHMQRYGELIGLVFQSIDDLLDGDGYVRLVKPREIHARVRDLIAQAKREIKEWGGRAEKLNDLTDFLAQRAPKETHA